MIPHLIESLSDLGPYDDVNQACLRSNRLIAQELQSMGSAYKGVQLPKVEYTMDKAFFFGRWFGSRSVAV